MTALENLSDAQASLMDFNGDGNVELDEYLAYGTYGHMWSYVSSTSSTTTVLAPLG